MMFETSEKGSKSQLTSSIAIRRILGRVKRQKHLSNRLFCRKELIHRIALLIAIEGPIKNRGDESVNTSNLLRIFGI